MSGERGKVCNKVILVFASLLVGFLAPTFAFHARINDHGRTHIYHSHCSRQSLSLTLAHIHTIIIRSRTVFGPLPTFAGCTTSRTKSRQQDKVFHKFSFKAFRFSKLKDEDQDDFVKCLKSNCQRIYYNKTSYFET